MKSRRGLGRGEGRAGKRELGRTSVWGRWKTGRRSHGDEVKAMGDRGVEENLARVGACEKSGNRGLKRREGGSGGEECEKGRKSVVCAGRVTREKTESRN